MEILDWLLSRIALDPDAGSFLILLGLLTIFGVATAVIVWGGNILYIKLWRYFRPEKTKEEKTWQLSKKK